MLLIVKAQSAAFNVQYTMSEGLFLLNFDLKLKWLMILVKSGTF